MLTPINNFSLKFPKNATLGIQKKQKISFAFIYLFASGSKKAHIMNKAIIVLFLVLGFSLNQAFAQRDQITTQAGEKIRCRILDETPTRFIYAYLSPTGKVLRNEIFKNLVVDFKYNEYPSDIVTKGSKAGSTSEIAKEDKPAATTPKTNTPKNEAEKATVPKKEKKTEDKIVEKQKKTEDKVVENKKAEEPITEKKKTEAQPIEKKPTEEKVAEKKTVPKKETTAAQTKTKEKVTKPEQKTKENAPLAQKREKGEYDNYLKFRIGVRGGFGNMLSKIEATDEFGLYQEKLLRGWTWGADMAYFPGDNFGFGLMFNNFQTKNSAESIQYKVVKEGELTDASGSLSNKRSTKFIGPVAYFRKNIDYKTMVILGLAPGAYFYSDKGDYSGIKTTYKGMDFGAAATLGIDFLLGNDISGRDIILSLEAGYNYGKMRAINFSDGNGAVNLAQPLDLSRVDFTVGLRFTRYPRYFKN